MNTKEYIEKAMVTSTAKWEDVRDRLSDTNSINLLHASMGLATEAGEFVDTLKKYVFYGKEIDLVNLKEELGDCCWYFALACHTLDVSFEEVMETNIKKLRARYGDGFSEERALNRDLDNEREILEK